MKKCLSFFLFFGAVVSLLVVLGTVRNTTAASPSEKPAPPSPLLAPPLSLPLQEARVIIEGTEAYARSLNMRCAVFVLDNVGNMISADRMDGAPFNVERFARGKAFAAVIMRQPSAVADDLMKTRPDRYHGILNLYPGEIYFISGGLPLAVENRLVGAVGVAGLPPGVDEKAAEAGIAAWQKYRQGMNK